jgi:hypothetical protein
MRTGSPDRNRAAAKSRRLIAAAAGLTLLLAAPKQALADCKPTHASRSVVLASMGPCAFDPEELQFAGTPAEQSACLLRPVKRWAKLGPVLTDLPSVLAQRVGRTSGLPEREVLGSYMIAHDVEADFTAHLWDPVTHAGNNDPAMPVARYIVFHDTSGPFLNVDSWPADIDTNSKINNLAGHRCEDHFESAHVFINRTGAMLVGHELDVPWRATKFERALQFGSLLKGLFLHVEMVQPRRAVSHMVRIKRRHHRARWVRRSNGHDILAPTPGFTDAQYDRLALVYVLASVRAGHWLIPAFHAVIDGHIPSGHDDPQNFELAKLAVSLQQLLDELQRRQRSLAALRALGAAAAAVGPPR